MFGLLLEVVALMPARVPLNQSPVFFLWQDWALGAMYTKITIALTFMGPEWWLKRAIEQLYQVGQVSGDKGMETLDADFSMSHFRMVCEA